MNLRDTETPSGVGSFLSRNGGNKNKGLNFGLSIAASLGLGLLLILNSCSIPNLEAPQCSEARDTVKEFYSWYLGTDADMRSRQRVVYDRFVSPTFRTDNAGADDPFFRSSTLPTTFKIGKCESTTDSKARMQVQLYWREDGKTDQKDVFTELTKTGERWLIDKVESR